ncbi:MAG: DUF1080 domain-containing protein [Opitutae bacterium]|nr:DUF1080 domain-containing protein [Opitutae bacterium]
MKVSSRAARISVSGLTAQTPGRHFAHDLSPREGSTEAAYSHFKSGEWNRYRIRLHDDRHQIWVNNRVVSDTRKNYTKSVGMILLACSF